MSSGCHPPAASAIAPSVSSSTQGTSAVKAPGRVVGLAAGDGAGLVTTIDTEESVRKASLKVSSTMSPLINPRTHAKMP
eukprot:765317-Rhodomonas_salina.1